jgi:hypothetical protein
MIEQKDLDIINKICGELEALGYSKPDVGISAAVEENFRVHMSFSKIASQIPEKDTAKYEK